MDGFEIINESFISSLKSKLEDKSLTFDQRLAIEKILKDGSRFSIELNILIVKFLKS